MNHPRIPSRLLMLLATCGASALTMLSLSGCAIFGVVAQTLPPPSIKPQFTDLNGQSVAIMVWSDRGTSDQWPDLPLDTTAGLEHKLKAGQPHFPKLLKDTTFPVNALAIVRDQEDHPEWKDMPITEVATQLHVSRLIYIEVNAFQTRSDESTDLYKGTILGSVKVVDIANGKAKIAYSEDGVKAEYPPASLEEGVLNAGDEKIYTGTLDAFTTELVDRFLPHDEKKN